MKLVQPLIDINPVNFDSLVAQSTIPVLLVVLGSQDSSQTALLSPFQKSMSIQQKRITLGCIRLNIYPELAGLIGIEHTPALLLFQAGEIIYKFFGQWSHRDISEIFLRMELQDVSVSSQKLNVFTENFTSKGECQESMRHEI